MIDLLTSFEVLIGFILLLSRLNSINDLILSLTNLLKEINILVTTLRQPPLKRRLKVCKVALLISSQR